MNFFETLLNGFARFTGPPTASIPPIGNAFPALAPRDDPEPKAPTDPPAGETEDDDDYLISPPCHDDLYEDEGGGEFIITEDDQTF